MENWSDEDGQEDEHVAAHQTVSVTFVIDRDRRETNLINTLLDTDSPVSFVEMSAVPAGVMGDGRLKRSGFKGLGDSSLYIYGTISTVIKIGDNEKLINLRVLPDRILPSPI